MEKQDSIFYIKPWILASIIVLIYLIVIYAKHEILISENVLLSEFKGDDFDKYLEVTGNFRLVKYFFLTIFFVVSITITFALVYLTNLLFELALSTRYIFITSLLACSVEILKELVVFCWFETRDTFVSTEVFNFYPLSLYSVFGDKDTSFPLSYVLQSIDLFFFVKAIIIISCVVVFTKRSIEKTTQAVLVTYVLPLLVFYAMVYIVM